MKNRNLYCCILYLLLMNSYSLHSQGDIETVVYPEKVGSWSIDKAADVTSKCVDLYAAKFILPGGDIHDISYCYVDRDDRLYLNTKITVKEKCTLRASIYSENSFQGTCESIGLYKNSINIDEPDFNDAGGSSLTYDFESVSAGEYNVVFMVAVPSPYAERFNICVKSVSAVKPDPKPDPIYHTPPVVNDALNYNWGNAKAADLTSTCKELHMMNRAYTDAEKEEYDINYLYTDNNSYYLNTTVKVDEVSNIFCNISTSGDASCNNIFLYNIENPNLDTSSDELSYTFKKVNPGVYNVVYDVFTDTGHVSFDICTNIQSYKEEPTPDPEPEPAPDPEPEPNPDPSIRPSALVVNYTYNIRSWTKSISSPLFTQNLYYNEEREDNTPSYNGNISRIEWTNAGNRNKAYNFGYDALSQLKTADYSGEGKYGASYSYDKHGNMLTLERMGKTNADYGPVDQLEMTYNGNQLVNVKDDGANVTLSQSADFKDHSNGYGLYEYNRNGAMTKDTHKGISNIEYNSLNLSVRMDINAPAAEARNSYLYSAGGVKLQVKQEWSKSRASNPLEGAEAFAVIGEDIDEAALDSVKVTDYVGNKIYENGELVKILVDGGYYDTKKEKYYFYIQDHLGNNRVVADTQGNVVQRSDYYPFGMEFADNTDQEEQPYKYNGKELDKLHGLNMYDYSARYMEPAIGRFTSVDPLAEKYYSWSPYAYVGNNPINTIDPTGMDWVHRVVDGIDEYYYDRNVRSQDDVISKYGEKGGVTHIASGTSFTKYNDDGSVRSQFTFFNDGSDSNSYGAVVDANGNLMADDQIIYGKDFTVFGTSDNSANAETLHKNLFGTSYIGGTNPKDYTGKDSYQYLPRNWSEYPAYFHDKDYDKLNATGASDAFTNIATYQADRDLANRSLYHVIYNNSNKDRARAAAVYVLFNQIANVKSPFYQARKAALKNAFTPAMPYAPFSK